jgi:anthranilate synthase component 2
MLEAFDGVHVTVRRNDEVSIEEADKFARIVLSPGPGIPSEAGLMPAIVQALAPRRKILGVCLGHQCIGEVFGGALLNLGVPIHGKSTAAKVIDTTEPLFRGLGPELSVGRYHSWVVAPEAFPDVLRITAVDEGGSIMALRHREFDVCGVQFHPESILTTDGARMLKNWVDDEARA